VVIHDAFIATSIYLMRTLMIVFSTSGFEQSQDPETTRKSHINNCEAVRAFVQHGRMKTATTRMAARTYASTHIVG
jgi:hypothetical protein